MILSLQWSQITDQDPIFLFLAILILGVFVVMAFVRFAKKYSSDGFVEVFPWLLLSVEIRPTIEFATNKKIFSTAEEYNVSSIDSDGIDDDSSEDMNLHKDGWEDKYELSKNISETGGTIIQIGGSD